MEIAQLISEAFAEDLPKGDLTTDNLGLTHFAGRAQLVAKEDLILAGTELFTAALKHLNPEIEIIWLFKDGQLVLEKQTVCKIKGDLLKLLKAERVALNFLGRLSGIATLTRCYVEKVANTNCTILDTRKTTPLFRHLEKMAVKLGGATNHRNNLSESVMIKDNHIRAAGSIAKAIENIRAKVNGPICVECTTLEEVETAVSMRVARIMLDNMTLEQMKAARKLIPQTMEVEATGNMTLDRVEAVAQLGVDFISVGAITHSAPCADFSLVFDWQKGEP